LNANTRSVIVGGPGANRAGKSVSRTALPLASEYRYVSDNAGRHLRASGLLNFERRAIQRQEIQEGGGGGRVREFVPVKSEARLVLEE
jgi:hypothetical protein